MTQMVGILMLLAGVVLLGAGIYGVSSKKKKAKEKKKEDLW